MFDAGQLREAVDLQSRTYQLLHWVNQQLRRGTLDFSVVHGAVSTSQAATEWIGRHVRSLPVEVRPRPGQLEQFGKLFASYLTTSFVLVERPGRREVSGCGCWCDFCRYLVAADHLQLRKPSNKAKASAVNLKRLYLRSLAESMECDLPPSTIEAILRDEDLAESLALATYGHELVRRMVFASQGEAVLVLWREFAWDRGFLNGDPTRPYHRPNKEFRLSAEAILEAEAQLTGSARRYACSRQ